ncbi:hypothetical protein DFQ27_003263 [Actinomortierella ambigua]|uniref:Uncharacterized protein n=1 Tax=Actinomortierella ambigua TaxID=1343610 RepID=A0A9P6U537_9FUNG|nr:hypothetical protein DFQ27_003263 [Actinomortierella ambigua]
MTANATVVRELCLQKVPSRIKGFTLEAMFQHSIFGNLTLLDLSFTNFAEFNIEPLFDIEKSDSGPTIAVFRFLSLQHLLLRNIHLEPISSPLLDSCPAARNLVSLIVDGVIAPVSTLCNLVRLFRTPTLKRVHISRPISSQTLANDDNPGGSGLNIHEQQLTPDNSLHDILDELLQRHVHHYHPSSLQHPPLLVLPQYASLGLEFLDSSEYQDTSSLSTQPRGLRLVSGYVTGHVVHRNLLTEDRLAAYLQSEQSQSLRELHMPSVAYDVKPFIDSFSNNNNNNSDAPMHAAGSDGDHQWMTWWSQVPYRWHCRHLRRLSLSFLTSSSDRSICLQSSRELFGFLTLNCPQIEELDLQSQWMLLTWDSGLCLISRWRCLRHLVLRGCSLGYESPGVKSMIQMNNKKSWEQGSLLGSWALTAPTMLRTTTTTIIPLDVEWIVQQPTEEHVQGRRTSRAICREVLWLPPFSRPCRQDMEDGMEAESKFMPYGAGKMLDQEGCEYENGSLAKALESMLELDPAPMRSSSVALNTGSSRSTSLSNDANPQGSTSPDGTTFSEKEEEDGSQTTVDAREGALWERLQSVQFVAETLSHTDWKRPQRQWDHFVGLCRQLRPDVDFQFSYARDVPDLLRS